MARRLAVLLLLAFGLAGATSPAFGGDNLGQQKASLDSKLAAVQARIAGTRARESALTAQIGSLDAQIGRLETQVGDVSTKLSALQADLRLRQRRLETLNKLYSIQTLRLGDLRREYSLAVIRLDDRLVSIYKQPAPGTIQLVLQASSFQDVMDEINYLGLVASEDKTIAAQVAQAKKLIQNPQRTAQVAKNADWAKIPVSAKTAVKTFIVDGAGERNLAAAYPVTAPSFRQGFTLKQWVHGDSLPFQVFPEMNFKVPMSFTLTQWTGKSLLADVGVDSKYTTGRGGYIFTVGAAKVGKRWLVNYWFPKYTPPVRATTGSFGSG